MWDEGSIARFAVAFLFLLGEQLAGDAADQSLLLFGIADMGAWGGRK